jgi:hypothetical protein
VEEALEPFSEHLEVDPYDHECYCVGSEARTAATKQAEEQLGKTIGDYRTEYHSKEMTHYTPWSDHIKPFIDLVEKFEKQHPLYQKYSPDCEECNGTGYYEATYNPQSKWDWYVVGGRWNGYITGKEGEGPGGDPYEDNYERNINKTDSLIFMDNIPFAVLTPDGTWHERGEMGWFGVAKNEQNEKDWEAYYTKLLEKYPGHYVIAVDCHI